MKKFLLIAIFLFANAQSAQAAVLEFFPPELSSTASESIAIPISLNTENEIINAFEGEILIPPNTTFIEARYTNSIVSFWLEEPKERAKGSISFSGVFPGGYQNISAQDENRGNLFTLVLEAKSAGNSTLTFGAGTKVLANDGKGTEVPLEKKELLLRVALPTGTLPVPDSFTDITPPESFEIEIVKGALFGLDGDVLVFRTTDKDSGVSTYEIARTWIPLPQRLLSWKEVESPALTEKYDAYRFIYVRAQDGKGNVTVAQMTPKFFTETYIAIVVLILLFGVLIFLRKRGILKRK